MAKQEVEGSCPFVINATFMASQDSDEWPEYSGGNIRCPHRDKCQDVEKCVFNQPVRRIYLRLPGRQAAPSQTDKFYGRLERHAEIRAAQEG